MGLLLIIALGLLANSVFKDHWGRPRPRQVDMFGGSMPFHQPWQPGPAPKNASFPAGHPTIYGVIMGMARIIQGGHFVTDVIWSAGFVYLTAILLTVLMKLDTEPGMTLPGKQL